MTEKKARSKHIGYNAQREQCRLNKYTYIEKINGVPVLFCNYPFGDPTHKKGLCKAGTCTDMREIPGDVLAADNDIAARDAQEQEAYEASHREAQEPYDKSVEDTTDMPCPRNE